MNNQEVTQLKAEIDLLRKTNRSLNRRANQADSYWQSRAMKAELINEWGSDRWKQEFDRMMRAHDELREIYLLVCDAEGRRRPPFHSVMDCKFDGRFGDPPGVWANMYEWTDKGTATGPITSERILDAVRRVLETHSSRIGAADGEGG